MKVIDVSKYNGLIDWKRATKNCDGAIIRIGYRGYTGGNIVKDPKFSVNLKGADAAGLKTGVYFVTQAITKEEARAEAAYCVSELEKMGITLDLPIFIDTEDGGGGKGRADHGKLTRVKRTGIIRAFCEEIEANGYKAGVYAGEYWSKTYLDVSKLTDFYLWIAKYSTKTPSVPYNAWQYTDKGKIAGITGNVDISDFTITGKSNEEIAEEVLNGEWGNGSERKKKLTAAGYDYKAVQKIVNQKIKEREATK